MKKNIFLLILILCLKSFGQINFEKGYFITDTNKKVLCEIKNKGWKYNPTTIIYKTTGSTTEKEKTITSIKEFGILNDSKYIRATVDMERSKISDLESLSNQTRPSFTSETHFLKVIIEGEVILYSYEEKTITRFFISKENLPITQLVDYKYLTNDRKVFTNEIYKQQLSIHLKNEALNIEEFKNLRYDEKSLTNIVKLYNTSKGSSYVVHKTNRNKGSLFNFNVKLAVNYISSFKSRYYYSAISEESEFSALKSDIMNLNSKNFFSLGFETEFILPFNKNKWSLFLEPMLHKYELKADDAINTASLKQTTVSLTIGYRYYLFLNENSKFFIDTSLINNLPLESNVAIFNKTDQVSINTTIDYIAKIAVGFGYKFNRNSLAFRYIIPKNSYEYFENLQMLSLVYGFTLF